MPEYSWEQAVQWLREQLNQEDLVKACYFDLPVLAAAERFVSSDEWREIRRHIGSSPGRVLDIGAGNGIGSYALSKDGWEVTALEPDPSLTVGAGAIRQLAKDSGLNINVVSDYGESTSFESESFDVVFGRQVLHHARDLDALCREVCRVLKPNGIFIATREHVISNDGDLGAFLAQHPLHKLYGGEYAYTLKRYLNAISGSGLALIKKYGPFDSPINCYPRTQEECYQEIIKRLGGIRLSRMAGKYCKLLGGTLGNAVLRLASSFSRTPGRLFTFIAVKP